MMSESVYRTPAEMPEEAMPEKPKESTWAAKRWRSYADVWREEGAVMGLAVTLLCALVVGLVGLLLSLACLIASDAIRDWRDPCAEYVSVPQPTTTVYGTPVTIQVRKCLRLKEGR